MARLLPLCGELIVNKDCIGVLCACRAMRQSTPDTDKAMIWQNLSV